MTYVIIDIDKCFFYTRCMIEYILLGCLNYGPATGYDLKQMIDHSTAHFWHAHHSQIYTTLRQMESDGLVRSEFIQSEGQPNRRVYTLLEPGQQALQAWLERPMTETTAIKEELLVRMFFSARRDPQKVLAELSLQRDLHKQQLAAYRSSVQKNIESSEHSAPELSRDAVFWQSTLNMGMLYEEMYIAWIDETMRTIEALK
jgi:PadR family transcriptional regulator, regulatory protein AphA